MCFFLGSLARSIQAPPKTLPLNTMLSWNVRLGCPITVPTPREVPPYRKPRFAIILTNQSKLGLRMSRGKKSTRNTAVNRCAPTMLQRKSKKSPRRFNLSRVADMGEPCRNRHRVRPLTAQGY